MKKRFIIIFFIIYIFLAPLSIYADNINIIDNSSIENNINTDYKTDETFDYKKESIPQIACKAAYIAEPNTGKVIYEKNAHEKMYPASTTKILTALVVIEKCQLTEKAKVSQNAIALVTDGYSTAELKEGEEFDIKTLLYALMLPSANEAANVLAEHVSGSIEAFAELCNNRAKELGCENLHFVNPNGMHDDNHYCSAYDLYLITKECQKHDIFNEIVKTKSFTIPATDIYPLNDRTFKNTNELLFEGPYYYPYCTGIKTGYTTPAGECLVASSFYNNIELISVVLGGKEYNDYGLNDRFVDTKELFEFTYNNYSIKTISNYGDKVAEIKVGKATKDTETLDVIIDKNISTIVPNEIDKKNIEKSIYINDDIIAPIKQNEILGKITFNADGLVYEANIIASHSVEKMNYDIYNYIVIAVVILTLLIIIILLIICKNHRIIVVIFEYIIVIIEVICILVIMKKGAENSMTRVNMISDLQSSTEIQNVEK